MKIRLSPSLLLWMVGCAAQALPTNRALCQDNPPQPVLDSVVVSELRRGAVPLATVDAGRPDADLTGFGEAVGDARLVLLGEASHGTREIFQMKHRLLEYLVRNKGFTVFAIEANWPESEAVDRYVKTGEGNPREALKAMYFWTWQTEEVLAMIEWMRAFNQAPGNHPILTFTSFDMQYHEVALERILEAVKGTPAAPMVEAAYAGLRDLKDDPFIDPGLTEMADEAERVVQLLEERKAAPRTIQLARIVAQAIRNRTREDYSYRDEMMARNVQWLLDEEHPNEKIVVWAHNSHVNTVYEPHREGWGGARWMGHWLREALGPQMYVLGFAIHNGDVRANIAADGKVVVRHGISSIPPADPGTGTATLSAVGVPLFFLNLTTARGALHQWLNEEHLFREFGAGWDPTDPPMRPRRLARHFDGLIFLEETSAARGLSP